MIYNDDLVLELVLFNLFLDGRFFMNIIFFIE